MAANSKINPDKITKPIQLLAAWLTGLIIINSTFLTAASQISKPTWAAGVLIIATVVNVPTFLVSLFLLQTKFRPEMQEDSFYSVYLERKYNTKLTKTDIKKVEQREDKENDDVAEQISKALGIDVKEDKVKVKSILKQRDEQKIMRRINDSRSLSELYLYPDKWNDLVNQWGGDEIFKRDLEELYFYKLISGDLSAPKKIELTDLGKKISENLQKENGLWHQKHPGVYKVQE
ncbi:MAG TPA: hypothetical protein VGN20_03475 [Mucilaginibacter sp.]|jgi:hypothetical protein